MRQFYIFCHFWGKSFSQLNCERTLAKRQSTPKINGLHNGIYFLRAVGIYIYICRVLFYILSYLSLYLYRETERRWEIAMLVVIAIACNRGSSSFVGGGRYLRSTAYWQILTNIQINIYIYIYIYDHVLAKYVYICFATYMCTYISIYIYIYIWWIYVVNLYIYI